MKAVLLTGTVGAGKTTLAVEVAASSGTGTAVVDLDWLGWVHGPDPHRLIVANLAGVARNLRAAGIERVLLTRAVRSRAELDDLRSALGPDTPLTVVRVVAPPETIEARLRERDAGTELAEHLAEHAALDAELAAAALEDLVFPNTGALEDAAARLLASLQEAEAL